jgi:hypothetical protein
MRRPISLLGAADAMSFINDLFGDLCEAQRQPDHWRAREAAELLEIYRRGERNPNR